MNAYYQNTDYTRTLPRSNVDTSLKIGDGLINFICAVITLLTCPVAIIMVKAVLCTVTFVGFFGVIGGIESGSISMLMGIVVCLALSLVECILLRSMVAKNKKQSQMG